MIYFYDTNILLDAEMQKKLFEHPFCISNISLNELENIKTSAIKDEEIKYRAREVLRLLNDNQSKYQIILFNHKDAEKAGVDFSAFPDTNDTKIVVSAYCYFYLNDFPTFTFVTRDLSCKAIAKAIGLTVETPQSTTAEYTGFLEKEMTDLELAEFYGTLLPKSINQFDLFENQYLLIKDFQSKAIIDKYKWADGRYQKILFQQADSRMFGKVTPLNNDPYQQIALDALRSNQITMLRGKAGTGKDYLAFAHLFNLLEAGEISRIVIFCNTVATKGAARLGFYTGSKLEKLLDSQIGNLLESKLGDKTIVESLIKKGQLILLPMSDIRGYDTTGMNAAVYITEAQNLDIELMKLALQRVGEDSICILNGDSDTQVDLSLYAGSNNGLRRVSEVFRGADFYGEVTLQNIYRSKIAKLAQEM